MKVWDWGQLPLEGGAWLCRGGSGDLMLRTTGDKNTLLASENLPGNELSSWVLSFFKGMGDCWYFCFRNHL